MSAETLSAVRGRRAAAPRRPGRPVRPVTGMLADGTVFYAPIGEVVIDDELVICHLCGRSLRSVTAHLRVHGWTPGAYREAFGLERGQSLEGPGTRKLRAAAFTSRLVFESAVREGSAAGRERARDGRLARDAAVAARGRSFPEQRRRKALRALAAIPPEVVAQANRERARRHLARVAAQIAQSQGYPDLGALVRDQVARGASLAGISRRAAPFTPPNAMRPGSALLRSPRASASTASPATSVIAGPPAGPGRPFPPNPASHHRGSAGTKRNPAPSPGEPTFGLAIAWDACKLDHLTGVFMRLSARNQIPARVTRITSGEAIANVELDGNGVRLVASITVEAVRDLGLAEGSQVTAVIKASEVILATGD